MLSAFRVPARVMQILSSAQVCKSLCKTLCRHGHVAQHWGLYGLYALKESLANSSEVSAMGPSAL